MTPLPAPPSGPLHILPEASLLLLAAAAAAVLVVVVLLTLRRLMRRRPATPAPPSAVPKLPTPTPRTNGIGSRIRALEEKILASKAYRQGCHHLAMLTKSHLGQQTGLGVENMTSREIERTLIERTFAPKKASGNESDTAGARVGLFMTKLSRRRYGRIEPRRRDFVAACEEARALLVPLEGNE